MAMPLFYADLDAAWFHEGVPGLNQAFTDAGWQRLTWCEDADWGKAWMDKDHPERPTAAELLARLLVQLPSGTRRVLIVGDSTLTQHFREGWEGESILYDWVELPCRGRLPWGRSLGHSGRQVRLHRLAALEGPAVGDAGV